MTRDRVTCRLLLICALFIVSAAAESSTSPWTNRTTAPQDTTPFPSTDDSSPVNGTDPDTDTTPSPPSNTTSPVNGTDPDPDTAPSPPTNTTSFVNGTETDLDTTPSPPSNTTSPVNGTDSYPDTTPLPPSNITSPVNGTDPAPNTTPLPPSNTTSPVNGTDPDLHTTPSLPSNTTSPVNGTDPDPDTTPSPTSNTTSPVNDTDPVPDTTPLPRSNTTSPANGTDPDPNTTPSPPSNTTRPVNGTDPDPDTTPSPPTNTTSPVNGTDPDPDTTPPPPSNTTSPVNGTDPDPDTTPSPLSNTTSPVNGSGPDPDTTPSPPFNATSPVNGSEIDLDTTPSPSPNTTSPVNVTDPESDTTLSPPSNTTSPVNGTDLEPDTTRSPPSNTTSSVNGTDPGPDTTPFHPSNSTSPVDGTDPEPDTTPPPPSNTTSPVNGTDPDPDTTPSPPSNTTSPVNGTDPEPYTTPSPPNTTSPVNGTDPEPYTTPSPPSNTTNPVNGSGPEPDTTPSPPSNTTNPVNGTDPDTDTTPSPPSNNTSPVNGTEPDTITTPSPPSNTTSLVNGSGPDPDATPSPPSNTTSPVNGTDPDPDTTPSPPFDTASTISSSATTRLAFGFPEDFVFSPTPVHYKGHFRMPDEVLTSGHADVTSDSYLELKDRVSRLMLSVWDHHPDFEGLIVALKEFLFVTEHIETAVQSAQAQVTFTLLLTEENKAQDAADALRDAAILNPSWGIDKQSISVESGIPTQYHYGADMGDTLLACNHGVGVSYCHTPTLVLPSIWVGGHSYDRIQVHANGLVSLGEFYRAWKPPSQWGARFDRMVVLAPLWVDAKLRPGTEVWYQWYDRTQLASSNPDTVATTWQVLNKASADAVSYSGFSQFDASLVVVVTWVNIYPRVYDDQRPPNTVQLVIIGDSLYKKSVTFFNYPRTNWDSERYIRDSMIGYTARAGADVIEYSNPHSNKPNAFRMDRLVGNFGIMAAWVYTLSTGAPSIDYGQKCIDWWVAERSGNGLPFWIYNNWLTAQCPCDRRQLSWDRRWITHSRDDELGTECFIANSRRHVSKMCCYDNGWPGWWSAPLIRTEDGRGGHLMMANPRSSLGQGLHLSRDVDPKEWCCHLSDNCRLFYDVRPIDTCGSYRPPSWSWGFGDPHFRTPDGFEYTFNGQGEYTMLETAEETGISFTFQSRLCKVHNYENQLGNATVISAVAARSAHSTHSDTLQVEMDATRSGLQLYVNHNNWTDQFRAAAVNVTTDHYLMTVTKTSTTSMEAVFESGFSLTITLKERMLDLVVGAPTEFMGLTRGLLGVFNNNTADDLTAPDGTVLPPGVGEERIFHEFGQLWKLGSVDASLFTYFHGESFYTYRDLHETPVFSDSLQISAEVLGQCGDNKQCQYDATITGNIEAGLSSKAINQQNADNYNDLGNFRPLLLGEDAFNVLVGRNNTYAVGVQDADGDKVKVTMTSSQETSATFDNGTLTLTWAPESMEPVTFTFNAQDARGGMSAALTPRIRLCNCTNGGQCIFDQLADNQPRNSTVNFRIVACNCSTGRTGAHCEEDYNGCLDNPCEGFDCTDLTPEQEETLNAAITCSGCPEGFELDPIDKDCVDVDECDGSGSQGCSQDCLNTPGSYDCACHIGYRITNAQSCEDIDECAEGRVTCGHLCKNLEGTYECECLDGYTLTADGACEYDRSSNHTTPCEDADLTCSHGCNATSAQCFCPRGFTMATDGQTCEDVDECATTIFCDDIHGTCENTHGAYKCDCTDGYKLQPDGTTCIPCLEGTFGPHCALVCTCQTSDTPCDPKTGCSACATGWMGDDCTENINECAGSAPCGANTVCTDIPGDYRCDCQQGYDVINKTHCQEIDSCASLPCLNAASCTSQHMDYSCECLAGYTDRICSTDINDCVSDPCMNSGLCVDRVNSFLCECSGNWTGALCETPILECPAEFVFSATTFDYSVSFTWLEGYNDIHTDNKSQVFKGLEANITSSMWNSFGCHGDFKNTVVMFSNFVFRSSDVDTTRVARSTRTARSLSDTQIDVTFTLSLSEERTSQQITAALLSSADARIDAATIDAEGFQLWMIAVIFGVLVVMAAIIVRP